jgi:hypothetical protein
MWKRIIMAATTLTLLLPIAAVAQQSADALTAFDRMKRLVGTWSASGQGAQVTTFKMAGGGRVLVQESGGTLENTFHLDVDKLMVTHYCGSGNQPRMRVRELDDRHMTFEMFDITNLANPQSYHTTNLDIVFVGPDRIDLTYRGTSGGPQLTQLTRKKS